MVDCQVRPSDVTRYPIIQAMLDIPREAFVPRALQAVAYLGEHVSLGPRRVLLDPRVFAKMLDAVAIGKTDLVLDLGCGLGYSAAVMSSMAEAVIAQEEDPGMSVEAVVALADLGLDNVAVETAPLVEGVPAHGPYDVIFIEGGIETLPDSIAGQLKVGGRIVAIFMEGALGQARLGRRHEHGISWRRAFDAAAPVLPGFEREEGFEF